MLAVLISALSCNANMGEYDAEGYFEATEVTVSAEANGRILDFGVQEGAVVEAGEQLGCIDRPDIDAQLKAMYEQLKTLEKEESRLSSLLADGAATRKQMDDLQSQISVLKLRIDAQESALENSVSSLDAQNSGIEMQIAQVDDQLSKCRIKSPVSGTVLTKYAEAGEFASVGKPLFMVADLDHVFLRAYVTSAQLSELSLGRQVRVFSDYGRGYSKEYAGTVSWISDRSEFTPKNIQTEDERKNLVYAVKITVENDGLIKLGMYGGVIF